MLDMRSDFERFPLRRSFSGTNLQRHNRNFSERSHFDGSFSEFPSPAQSELSIRTAPPMSTGNMNYQESYPPSVSSLPAYPRQGLWRSASQPSIRNSLTKTGTYPQGILKRNDNSFTERPQTRQRRASNSSYSTENQQFGRGTFPQESRYSKQVMKIYHAYFITYKIRAKKQQTKTTKPKTSTQIVDIQCDGLLRNIRFIK